VGFPSQRKCAREAGTHSCHGKAVSVSHQRLGTSATWMPAAVATMLRIQTCSACRGRDAEHKTRRMSGPEMLGVCRGRGTPKCKHLPILEIYCFSGSAAVSRQAVGARVALGSK